MASKQKAATKGATQGATKGGAKGVTKGAAKSAAKAAVKGPLDFKPYKIKKTEEYMSDAQLEHFRAILTAWKTSLMEEVDRTVHHMQDDAAIFPDPLDRAAQEEEFSLELRTRDRERKLIGKITQALINIDNGEYGYCATCGADIGIRRLEARPTAELCIDCKTFDEIRERQETG